MTYNVEKAPLISVIIPVYNTERYLRECLDSVVKQTLQDIEIICIDDGSTDNSLDILREYASKDERIIIHSQENKGGGAARNLGLEIAKGEYLAFLDSDDFFNIQALEKTYRKALEKNSDIVVFNAQTYHHVTKQYGDASWVFVKKYFPENIPFSYSDVTDHIFNLFSSTVWNKLYRKKMIEQFNIKFQELKRSNDLFFAYFALISAEKIDVLDDMLVFYRKGIENNVQSTNHETPLDYYCAMIAVKEELIKQGIFDKVERSYFNRLLGSSIYTLLSLKKGNVFDFLFYKIKNDILQEIDFKNRQEDYFHDMYQYQYNEARKIDSSSSVEYLFDMKNIANSKIENLRNELDLLKKERKYLRNERDAILASYSYRIGRLIAWLPRKIKAFLLRKKN